MYSNDQTQIRQGLVNYIGALLKASPFEKNGTRQNVSAILIEEALKIAENNDKTYSLYVLKPLFRATVVVLKQRCSELSKLPIDSSSIVIQYEKVIKILEELLKNI